MTRAIATYEQTVLDAFGQVADMLDALAHDAEQLTAEADGYAIGRRDRRV